METETKEGLSGDLIVFLTVYIFAKDAMEAQEKAFNNGCGSKIPEKENKA